MPTKIHTGDTGTAIMINVTDEDGDALDDTLNDFTTRVVRLMPPSAVEILVNDVDIALDTDNIQKLRIVTGSGNDFSVTEPGLWRALVTLGDSGHTWTTPEPVSLFYALS